MREHVMLLQKEDYTLNLLDMVAQFGAKDDRNPAAGIPRKAQSLHGQQGEPVAGAG